MSKELLTEPKNIFSVFLQCPSVFKNIIRENRIIWRIEERFWGVSLWYCNQNLKTPRNPFHQTPGLEWRNSIHPSGPHTKIHIIFDPGQKVGLLGHGVSGRRILESFHDTITTASWVQTFTRRGSGLKTLTSFVWAVAVLENTFLSVKIKLNWI